MTPRFNTLLSLLALLCALISASAFAQIPRNINYQGYLTNPGGVPVNATVPMTLKLYDAITAGTVLHTETQMVSVANGIFNVQIGTATPLTLPFTTPYFLGVTIAADPEMIPRQPLAAAPYAVTAENIAPGGSINLSDSMATVGNIFKNGSRFLHNAGDSNTFLGYEAGNFSLTGAGSVGVGHVALSSLTQGGSNTALGYFAARSTTTGSGNVAIGGRSLSSNVGGSENVSVGQFALQNSTANDNIGIGARAGNSLTTGGNNIMIGNVGLAGESDTIRLGTPGNHTRTFLAGTVNTADILATGAISSTQSVTVVSGTQPKSVVLPTAIGVNLGAAVSPNRPLTIQADVSGGGSEWISFMNGTGTTRWHVNHKNAGVNFAESGVADGRLFLAAGGNVGIGTDTPTRATLEVLGSNSTTLGAAFRVNASGVGALAPSSYNLTVYASNAIAANEFLAFSDQRMKRITGRSNAARDLITLAAIEVTDYTHVDIANRGDKSHKKVIAQQVEKVYPQAVNQITDVVPDIYQRANVNDGWIALTTDLKKGDRVRVIGKASQGVHEVLEVAAGHFRTGFVADTDTVFVYGREVKDFRTVDYEAIAMLNVSATQELHRRVEAQAAEIATLRTQLAQLGDLQEKVAMLMAHRKK